MLIIVNNVLVYFFFAIGYHEWLLGDKVDLLPRLLLPLAGPEEFDDDDMEKLPEDLQYLPPDKKREADPDIRKIIVQSIFQVWFFQFKNRGWLLP